MIIVLIIRWVVKRKLSLKNRAGKDLKRSSRLLSFQEERKISYMDTGVR